LIFAVESPETLHQRATAILQNTENILELSVISLSEIAIKAARGKLKFSAADTRHALRTWTFEYCRTTANHAFPSFRFTALARGPLSTVKFIAQALSEEIPVMTCDEKFSLYKGSQGPLVIVWNFVPFQGGSRRRFVEPQSENPRVFTGFE